MRLQTNAGFSKAFLNTGGFLEAGAGGELVSVYSA